MKYLRPKASGYLLVAIYANQEKAARRIMIITTHDPKTKKVVKVGELVDKVFYKKVSSKHFFKLSQSYGIQEVVMQVLQEEGCEYIVFETPTGKLLSEFRQWLEPGVKVQDFGHGKQRFLPVKYMKKIN